jgi:hypothetical protein
VGKSARPGSVCDSLHDLVAEDSVVVRLTGLAAQHLEPDPPQSAEEGHAKYEPKQGRKRKAEPPMKSQ